MKKQETPSHKKFFFDVHNFDENEKADDVIEDLPPPPPTFSEEELAAAREESRAQGYKEGYAASQESIEKQVLDTLNIVRNHFNILFEEEERRARIFEKEAVQLAATIFARAFPDLNERHGMEEVKAMLQNVLETVQEMPEIIIDVPPAYVEAIQTHVNALLRMDGGPRCIVRGSDSLGPGQCRMAWANGTAARNGPALAEQIRGKIAEVLADDPILTDNKGTETHNALHADGDSHE
jgi:flagellar assembly protein FliH